MVAAATATAALCLVPSVASAANPPTFLGPPVVHPGNPDSVWLTALVAAGGDRVMSTVHRSDDGGATVAEVLRARFTVFSPLHVRASASGMAYAVLEKGVIRRSSDDGGTWQALPGLPGAFDVAVGPPPTETVFAMVGSPDLPSTATTMRRQAQEDLCGDPDIDANDARGVYRLEGAAWRQVAVGPVDAVYPHPTDPSVVLAVTLGCILHRSTDGGATFALVPGERPSMDDPVFDPSRPGGLLWLEGDGGLVRSDDGAATWQRIGTAPPLSSLAQPAADRPSRVIGLVRPSGNDDVLPRRLVVSEDFGATWRELWRSGPFGVSGVAIAPSASNRVYAATLFALLRSNDGGATWSAHGKPLDGHGPAVAVAAHTLELRPTLGGRRPASVHVPLVALAPDEHTFGAVVRVAFRFGGRLQTAGTAAGLFGARSATVGVRLTRAAARAVRAEGSVDALVRVRAIDDAGQERVRWEPVTLTG